MHKTSLTIRSVCERADIGRTTVYKLIREGKLRSFRIGSRRLITVASFIRVFGGGEG